MAEWTNAAALKAAGRKARRFESCPFRQEIARNQLDAGLGRVSEAIRRWMAAEHQATPDRLTGVQLRLI